MMGINAVQNRTIQIRLREDEKEQILQKMRDDGFQNLSPWIREKLLKSSLEMEKKIDEMYQYINERKVLMEMERKKRWDIGEDINSWNCQFSFEVHFNTYDVRSYERVMNMENRVILSMSSNPIVESLEMPVK